MNYSSSITSARPNRFGIKEVADVVFYNITSTGEKGTPVLFLDTLKTSNLEFTAEQSEAKGGKGNSSLLIWDHSREVTLTLQDALLSTKTLEMLFEEDISNGNEIVVHADKFPGTYYIEGFTYARDESDGKDKLFNFVIPKAKIQSDFTLTMEAEGDPSVCDITIRVLRPTNGEMVKMSKIDTYTENSTIAGYTSATTATS